MNTRIRLRTLLMGGIFTLLFAGLIFRVYYVQVGPVAAKWAEKARQTWMSYERIPADRGTITDRNGKVLAADAAAYTVAVGPRMIASLDKENPNWRIADQIVAELHRVLGTSEADLRRMIAAKREDGTFLEQKEIRPDGWKIDKLLKDKLEQFREELLTQTGKKNVGLYFIEEQKRYYPSGTLAAHIVGYTNKDGEAVIGLEKAYDDILRGEPGYIRYEKDNTGTQLPGGQVDMKQAINGQDIRLTIDRDIQFEMEEALREAFDKYKPLSITAIAVDPKTMDILGMAGYPTFDPNQYWNIESQAQFKDNAIQSVYEPGSTFKIVTLAGAVEEGLFDPDETYKSGSIRVPGATIRDHNNGRGWGEISFLEGLKYSSNVAFVNMGYEKLGAEKLRHYIDQFGFGDKTGIELPGELSGAITFRNRIASEVATAAFGQGKVLVTPLQQVAAVSAVANGGKLMKPRLIESIYNPVTGTKTTTEPSVIRQVISERTSRQVGAYLESVVSDQQIGTGRNAHIPGYRIAGKTGTAQKVDGTEYSEDKFAVSFIGYAPVEDPQIVLYVLVDEPQAEFIGGGSIAAPIFKKIMEQSLRHLGIEPYLTNNQANNEINQGQDAATQVEDVTAALPDVQDYAVDSAKRELGNRSFHVVTIGRGNTVVAQLPKAGSVLPVSQPVYLLTETIVDEVPDLAGLSLRDAMEMCALLKAVCTPQGAGYVKSQEADQDGDTWKITLMLAPPGNLQDDRHEDDDEGDAETAEESARKEQDQ